MDRPRRPQDPFAAAEAAFKKAPARPAPDLPKPSAIPGAKRMVSIRLDADVIEHFEADGPGWQERINAALRRSIET